MNTSNCSSNYTSDSENDQIEIEEPINVTDIDITINEPIINEPIISEPIINEPIISNNNSNENDLLKSLSVLIANSTIGQSLGTIITSLTPDEINILKQLISLNPDSLSDINKCILEIIKDGKIDVIDIPPLIKIIKDIYVLSHEQITIQVPSLVNAIGSILKYLLQVILTDNNIYSPDLIKSCDGLVDIVVDIIKLKPSFKLKSKACFLKFW